jgi:hypothetical protein
MLLVSSTCEGQTPNVTGIAVILMHRLTKCSRFPFKLAHVFTGSRVFVMARHRYENWMLSVVVLALLMAAAWSAPVIAQQLSGQQMKGLDEQVQEIKSDVLNIATELSRLEEQLLYPSDTQVAVFVSMSDRDQFRLDALHVSLNGKAVAHHIYSYKELEALQKGGIQRIYTGNLPTGEHEIEVSLVGKLDNGREYTRSRHFRFIKDVNPKLLGITVVANDRDGIQIGDW